MFPSSFYENLANYSKQMNNEDTAILHYHATEVMELLEDSVAYLCDEHFMSGEKAWVMIRALADINLANFPNEE